MCVCLFVLFIRAKKNLKGVHSPKDPPTHKVSDFSGVSHLLIFIPIMLKTILASCNPMTWLFTTAQELK